MNETKVRRWFLYWLAAMGSLGVVFLALGLYWSAIGYTPIGPPLALLGLIQAAGCLYLARTHRGPQ